MSYRLNQAALSEEEQPTSQDKIIKLQEQLEHCKGKEKLTQEELKSKDKTVKALKDNQSVLEEKLHNCRVDMKKLETENKTDKLQMDILRRRIEILINENKELGECKANHEEINAVLQHEIEIQSN